MTESARDLLAALQHTKRKLVEWRQQQRITEDQLKHIAHAYDNWIAKINPDGDYAAEMPPAEMCLEHLEELEHERRNLVFLANQLDRLVTRKLLSDEQGAQFQAEVARRLAGLRDRLAGHAEAVDDAPIQRTLVEQLLDPRSLHIMMITGGALLVFGLVVWLWSIGVFENPLVVASCVGGANLALLAGGASLVRYSRHQTAGRAITLLACLVMPLNLWFYDAQGLITLTDGGRLWVPALVCCVLYAGVARLLKDPMFVYTLVAGVAMTGLLFLADQQVGRFWEVIGPSTFLVVLGAICIHVERLFTTGDSPFSRRRFGKAFFVAGHVAMAVGLVVLLSGRLVGWFYEPMFAELGWFAIPEVATVPGIKLWALLLALLGTYTYVYSQFVANSHGRTYAYSAVMTLLWCEVILLDLLSVTVTEPVVLLVLASTGLAAHLASTIGRKKTSDVDHLGTALGGVGAVCTAVAVGWGAIALLRGLVLPLGQPLAFAISPLYGTATLVAATACGVAAWGERRRGHSAKSTLYLQALGLPVVGLAASGFVAAGVTSASTLLALVMLLPVGFAMASIRASADHPLSRLLDTAQAATMFLLLLSVTVLAGWTSTVGATSGLDHLSLAGFYAAAAGVMGTVAFKRRTTTASALAGVSGCAAVWQLLAYAGFAEYAPMVAASAVGLATIVAARLLSRRDQQPAGRLAVIGAVIVTLGAAAGLLMTMGRLLADEPEIGLLGLAAGQAVVALAASLLTRSEDWKRTSQTLAGLHTLAGVLVVNVMSPLTIWERGEIFTVAVGMLLLVVGHLRWRREGESRDPLVDFNLLTGSLLAAGPLVLGLLAQRFNGYAPFWGLGLLHEVGSLAVGLALVGAGVVCRIRSTTLVGSTSLALWVLSLVALVHLPELESAAIMMMVGGGVFFAVAVLLSVYRDRLLALPSKVKNREGVFRVLEWR